MIGPGAKLRTQNSPSLDMSLCPEGDSKGSGVGDEGEREEVEDGESEREGL